jgi:PAS domain S-box-containing protein
MKLVQKVNLRFLVVTLLLTLVGYASNYLSVPIVYSVTFIFGSLFSIIALRAMGFWSGILTAFLASVYTYYLWNHPYAIIIFTAEIIWIGAALKRGKNNLIIIDSIFWLALGSPLVALFYYGVMRLGLQITAIIILKQSINGILNALAASIILTHTPIISWIRREKTIQKSAYSLSIFHLVSAFLMVPTLALVLIQNYQSLSSTQERVMQEVTADAAETNNMISDWIFRHINAVHFLSELGREYPKSPSAKLQQELHDIFTLFPDFYNVSLGDSNATTFAFYPAVNEKGQSTIGLSFADRQYFRQLKETLQPVISDVIMGRGGIFRPTFTISVPISVDGQLSHFGLGAINLQKMEILFQKLGERKHLIHIVIDTKNNVVYSSDPSRKPLAQISESFSGQTVPVSSNVFLRIPGSRRNISIMSVWKDAVYFTKLPIEGTPWTLLVEYPIGPLQKSFYNTAIISLGTISLIYLVMISLAFFLSNLLTRQLKSLSLISKDIPQKIDNGESLFWPQSDIAEVSELIDHYAEMALTLENKLLETRERYKVLVDISPSGIWLTDKTGSITYTSSKWNEIKGINSEKTFGNGWIIGIHPDDKQRVSKDWDACVKSKSDFQAEYRIVNAEGRDRWIWSIASTIKEKEEVVGWIGTITDITDRIKKEELRISLKEKETLLHEIHHRVKNNMQVISSLLKLQANNLKDNHIKEVLKASQNRIYAMSAVHETLHGSEKLSEIDLQSYLSKITTSVFQTYAIDHQEVKLSCNIEKSPVSINQAYPIGLVINELISNSLKYAFPEERRGEIIVNMEKLDGELELTVKDDGVGMPENLDWKKSSSVSLGLKLVRNLVENQLDGSIDMESKKGTKFTIKFNINT